VGLELLLSTHPERHMQTPSRQRAHPATSGNLPPTFLRMSTVVHMTGLCRSTIYRLIAENKFPTPVRLSDRAVAWRQTDLDRWSAERMPAPH